MIIVEVEGLAMDFQRPEDRVHDVLLKAVRQYLDHVHQPNHARVLSHRVEGRGERFVRYDVDAETDSPTPGRRRRRDFDVTILAGRTSHAW